MKRYLVILSFVALLFSCVRQQEEAVVEPQPLPFTFDEGLLAVDSLLQHDADSALIALFARRNSGNSGNDTVFNKSYHSLLLSEALYKTDNPQLNRFRNETMHYFDSLAAQYPYSDDIVLLSARSHYMNGVGFYENDSVVEACQEYLHTLEIMEEHFDVEKLTGYKAKFMGLTYNRLGELFSGQFMIEPAIYCSKKSLFYCQIEPTSKYGIANSLVMIGKQYHEIDNKDSASYYYRQALMSLPDYNNSLYRDILTLLELLDYQMGKNPEIALDSLRKIVLQTNDYNERLTRYITIGYIFYEEKRYDSALSYLKKVYYDNDDVLSKMQVAEYLHNIYQSYGDTIESNKFTKVLTDNAMTEYYKKAKTSIINELYQQHLKHSENIKHLKEKNIARNRTILTTTTIASLLIAVVFFVMRKWGKKRIDWHKKALAKIEDSLSDLQMKINVKQFADEPICKNIFDIVQKQHFKSKIDYKNYKEYALGKEQIVELRTTVNLHYDNFTIKIKNRYPELTNEDIDYCCLYLLGLKDADISALMQKDYSAVCRRRRKLTGLSVMDKILVFDCNTIS